MTTALSARRPAELVEFGEADAYEDLFQHAPPDLGLSVVRSGGAVLLIAPSLPVVIFNRVIGLGLRKPASEATLDEILARRIRDAAEWGCRRVITETGGDTPEHPNPSYHNMLRAGFVLVYQRPNYIAQA